MPEPTGRSKKSPRGTATALSEIRHSEEKSRLAKLVKAIGNDEIKQRIQEGRATREMMLQFVTEHMREMAVMQQRERLETKRQATWNWWRTVADANVWWQKNPRPNRWKGPAEDYKRAADAIARGDLRRGQQLIEKAIQTEQEVIADTTSLVSFNDLDIHANSDPGEIRDLVAHTPVTGACPLPPEIHALYREMMHVDVEIVEMPNRRRRRDPWWTEEEEEEDEADGAGG